MPFGSESKGAAQYGSNPSSYQSPSAAYSGSTFYGGEYGQNFYGTMGQNVGAGTYSPAKGKFNWGQAIQVGGAAAQLAAAYSGGGLTGQRPTKVIPLSPGAGALRNTLMRQTDKDFAASQGRGPVNMATPIVHRYMIAQGEAMGLLSKGVGKITGAAAQGDKALSGRDVGAITAGVATYVDTAKQAADADMRVRKEMFMNSINSYMSTANTEAGGAAIALRANLWATGANLATQAQQGAAWGQLAEMGANWYANRQRQNYYNRSGVPNYG